MAAPVIRMVYQGVEVSGSVPPCEDEEDDDEEDEEDEEEEEVIVSQNPLVIVLVSSVTEPFRASS